jgi:hypothetical protein
MNAGDLVKCNYWVHEGKAGIIVKVQDAIYCQGVYVLLECGSLKLVRIENLEILSESK